MKFLHKYKDFLLLSLMILLAFLVRFYNFEGRVNFGPEQAISLLSAGGNLTKFSLLGIEYILRVTSGGLHLYHSPLFGYSLIPLMLIFNFNPIPITGYFATLNIFTGLVLYWTSWKIFKDRKAALISLILFLSNTYMIYHSLFIWISNYMPLVGLLNFYLLYLLAKNRSSGKFTFLIGVVSGIGFGIQYFYLFTVLINCLFVILFCRRKITGLLFLAIGFLVGELPTVIFDLKHNFYHLYTLWQYFVDTITIPGTSKLNYYHLLSFWSWGALGLGLVLSKLWNRGMKLVVAALVCMYVFININNPLISFAKPIGMLEGLNWEKIYFSSEVIANDASGNFNVVSLLDFNAQGHILRYPLEYIFHKKPMEKEEYPNAAVLYVLGKKNHDFAGTAPWEITSFAPYQVDVLSQIDENYSVYKLTKK